MTVWEENVERQGLGEPFRSAGAAGFFLSLHLRCALLPRICIYTSRLMLRTRLPYIPVFRLFSNLMQASTLRAPSGTRTTTTVTSASPKLRLPRLPVPDLHRTLQSYLTSLEPFLLEDDVKGVVKYEEALALRKQWADDFERGLGSVLQERLKGLSLSRSRVWLSHFNCRST